MRPGTLSRLAAAAAATFLVSTASAADLVFGDFENGLDANWEVVQFNGGPNSFNGSTTNNVTHGAMSGNVTTGPGFQQYLRFNNSIADPGTVPGELGNYQSLAMDITVPAGTVPTSFFVHELVINATGFPFVQSGNITPTIGAPDDLKGRGTVTLKWNYHARADFNDDYNTFLNTPNHYFQILLVSNWGNGWDGGSFDIDNVRLTDAIGPTNASWNVDADGNWSLASNWTPSAPNAAGAIASFGSVIQAPRIVTVDAPQTTGQINFDNLNKYTIAGSSTLTLDNTSGGVGITVNSGSHGISAPLMLAKDTTITVTPSASILTLNNLQPSSVGITKAGAGKTLVNNVRASSLMINAGTVGVIGGRSTARTSRINSLTLAAGATLDLADQDLIVDYSGSTPFSSIRSSIISGYNNGSWNGTGITSSAAPAGANGHATRLGYAEASDVLSFSGGTASFSGQTLNDNTAVLVKYTLAGDSNLDGVVNLTDFTFLAANFNKSTGATWLQGDYNYDGAVGLTDFTFLAGNFNQSLPAASTGAPVPEPAASAVLIVALVSCARVRRR